MNFITDSNAKIKTKCVRCNTIVPELIKYDTNQTGYTGVCPSCYEKEKETWLNDNSIELNNHSIKVENTTFDFKNEIIIDDHDNVIEFNTKDIKDSLFKLTNHSHDSVVISRHGASKCIEFKCSSKLGHSARSEINEDVDPRVKLSIKRTKSGKTTITDDNNKVITNKFTYTQLWALYQYSMMYQNKIWKAV